MNLHYLHGKEILTLKKITEKCPWVSDTLGACGSLEKKKKKKIALGSPFLHKGSKNDFHRIICGLHIQESQHEVLLVSSVTDCYEHFPKPETF